MALFFKHFFVLFFPSYRNRYLSRTSFLSTKGDFLQVFLVSGMENMIMPDRKMQGHRTSVKTSGWWVLKQTEQKPWENIPVSLTWRVYLFYSQECIAEFGHWKESDLYVSLNRNQTTVMSLNRNQTTVTSLDRNQTTDMSLDRSQTTVMSLDRNQRPLLCPLIEWQFLHFTQNSSLFIGL